MDKPHAPACDRNREPILEVLRTCFGDRRAVLEIASGTGQHAVHFAAAMPWLAWQCSDLPGQLPGIGVWLEQARLPNTPPPLTLDVAHGPWPAAGYDAVFTANSLHIMHWPQVQAFFAGVARLAAAVPDPVHGLRLAIYGPFNHGGVPTSDSNGQFDAALRARDPGMGLRDLEAVDVLAARAGLVLGENLSMPANNRLLVWRSTRQAPGRP